MIDSFKREIIYARISLTDYCNLKCSYCMPNNVCKSNKNELSDEQIQTLVKVLIKLGITKVRFTGGEPLVRENVLSLLEKVCSSAPIEWAITTNGTTLKNDAYRLKKAGINHLNISLDTLNPQDYRSLTGGTLDNVLKGLEIALDAGFDTIRLNSVLINEISESQIEKLAELTVKYPIDVRFIELMPIGECVKWSNEHFLNANTVLDILPQLEIANQDPHAPAKYYKLPNAKGRIGLITPMSCNFCSECNRIRITSDGKLKPCLHSNMEVNLLDVMNDEELLEKRILYAVNQKPEKHYLDQNKFIKRNMTAIGG